MKLKLPFNSFYLHTMESKMFLVLLFESEKRRFSQVQLLQKFLKFAKSLSQKLLPLNFTTIFSRKKVDLFSFF